MEKVQTRSADARGGVQIAERIPLGERRPRLPRNAVARVTRLGGRRDAEARPLAELAQRRSAGAYGAESARQEMGAAPPRPLVRCLQHRPRKRRARQTILPGRIQGSRDRHGADEAPGQQGIRLESVRAHHGGGTCEHGNRPAKHDRGQRSPDRDSPARFGARPGEAQILGRPRSPSRGPIGAGGPSGLLGRGSRGCDRAPGTGPRRQGAGKPAYGGCLRAGGRGNGPRCAPGPPCPRPRLWKKRPRLRRVWYARPSSWRSSNRAPPRWGWSGRSVRCR